MPAPSRFFARCPPPPQICIFWLQPNGCPYADRCLYAHGADQLRSDVTGAPPGSDAEYNERYKTRM